MRMKNQVPGAMMGLIFILGLSGLCSCEAPNTTSTTTTNVNTNAAPSPVAAPTASSTTESSASSNNTSNFSITLPVLDAFFSDESFTGDLKNKLQLTDEQITKLRTIAREETAKLRETENEEYNGSTDAAHNLYKQKIEAELGPDKSRQLSDLVRARWNEGESNEEPNTSAEKNPSEKNPNATASNTGNTKKSGAIPTDTRIVVNAPAYRMDVFENGQLTKSYKVGIGYPEFPLPTGMRKASTIIFNPTWTPPDEPWVESPSSKVKVGKKVEAGSALNPLGPIKIPIGLPSLIHGGKQPAKLGGFASHGCVGLTNSQVQEFAHVLARLSGTNITPEQVSEYEKNKTETKNVKLEKTIPVELRYETIIVEDGKLHIYRDVYDRGTNTEENLRAVLASFNINFAQLPENERQQMLDALKKMARDATGKPADGQPETKPTASAADAKNGNKNESGKNESGKVTRTIKGEKEIVIQLTELKEKGYPAPVNLNTGGASGAATKKAKR